ncbi:MAG: TrmO family methyltransferase, partial [Bacteroidales bacterium]|nr:TrmO family methyltransferase [Bacteroidales bacterium]
SLAGIENRDGQWLLRLGGIDLVDGTPVLDIKPYVPWVDAIADARGGFADLPPAQPVSVSFTDACREQLALLAESYPALEELILQVIAQRPQPAYHAGGDGARSYGMALYDFNIRWRVSGRDCQVIAIEPLPPCHGQGLGSLA